MLCRKYLKMHFSKQFTPTFIIFGAADSDSNRMKLNPKSIEPVWVSHTSVSKKVKLIKKANPSYSLTELGMILF